MQFSELDLDHLTDAQRTALIFRYSDDGQKADLIFLAGSRMALSLRLPTAVSLYQDGRAKKLLISGGHVWPDQPQGEAVALAAAAQRQGVPAADILTETQSLYTLQNVQFSLPLVSEAIGLDHVQRIILVTNAYHMNRLYHMMRSYFPEHIQYSFRGTTDPATKPNNWFQTDLGRGHVEHELSSLQQAIRNGEVRDFPVDLKVKK
ncbi:YdcF family protein [Schleiferilactobacillus perolens]|jgi:uncharacterized SAM-binding protein YcdF (DUF218 family)|uniref:YdcF family protein n=1 Tax=Schleiferilactobacillus perolens TaxID=100468 RepID=UPI0023576DF0|nr:YdcF family protein [Schleiferilactobacillus perolens]MCI2171144.1 YdcF family protein [Schleiferilactobacillus perolens]